jgi:hypothetical protein
MADGYVLFLWKPTGYELVEKQGETPAVGDELETDNGRPLRVLKVGPSPIPGDRRPCVYSEPS